MKSLFLCLAAPILVWPGAAAQRTQNAADLVVEYGKFQEPPPEYRGHRWFTFRLSNFTEDSIRSGIQQAAKSDAFGAFMITPDGGLTTGLSEAYMKGSKRPPSQTGVAYLSEEYFRLYRIALEEGQKNHLPMRVLYDELQYPSGMAGGLLYSKYPESAAKSLEMVEKNVGAARTQEPITLGPAHRRTSCRREHAWGTKRTGLSTVHLVLDPVKAVFFVAE